MSFALKIGASKVGSVGLRGSGDFYDDDWLNDWLNDWGYITVRIPLDYYRILGLPIQATPDQLKQSHRDRTLQVPRREYSELAIDARRQLIDAAYAVLGDSNRRSEYDQEFLAAALPASREIGTKAGNVPASNQPASQSSNQSASLTDMGMGSVSSLPPPDAESAAGIGQPDVNVPTIEIENHQLVGALLILLELGEYELVLRLGRPYLQRDVRTAEGQKLKEQPALPDIILTLAVACLELGREEWQQNHYEHAAESLETGRELLLKEDLLPVLRAEIQADLYKLRPYRCLELIARSLDQKPSRQQGIGLLRGMLQDRGGIDGAEDDLSGLGVDDFLRFVQQLRGYLTAAEQQEVFEAEAQRPSAVGTYLAVYALLARGFAEHQPALIRRAKQMLLRLSGRQDVHLEQAVCAMLLGQTEEASRALELSQEYDPLAFIREHSQGSPDLLPGLCLYAENWLQQEVFPFFRDLDQTTATLKDYFADSAVQSYLENLPLESDSDDLQSSRRSSRQTNWATPPNLGSASLGANLGGAVGSDRFATESPLGSPPKSSSGLSDYSGSSILVQPGSGDRLNSRPTGLAGLAGAMGVTSIAERIAQMSPAGQLNRANNNPDVAASSRTSLGSQAAGENFDGGSGGLRDRRQRRQPARGSSIKWDRLLLLGLAGLGCLILAFLLIRAMFGLVNGNGKPAIKGDPLSLEINQSPVVITPANSTAESPAASDAAGIAEATINQWLETKTAAFSENYETDKIDDVLTGEALSDVQTKLQGAQADGWYVKYTHGPLKVISVEPTDATNAERLSAQAQVQETANFYEGTQPTSEFDYDEAVTARYDLVKEGDRWLIENIQG